jgi:DNA-binding MarR family transcriptional regulator
MAAEQRRKHGEIGAQIARVLTGGAWHGCGDLAETIGCSTGTASYHLRRLAENGRLETRPAVRGGFRYRVRQDTAAKAAETADLLADPAPDVPQAPAPASPPPEQPAPAPAPDTPAAQVGPEPAAGMAWATIWVTSQEGDPELAILRGLEDLPAERREALLQYAVGRWWLT